VKLLHRHIFWNVLATCAAAVGLFAFVLMVGNALKDLLSYALAGQLSPEALVKLLLLLPPYVLAYALPMGILTGVLLVLGRMSSQHEVTAMRAAGLSLFYIARPIIILGVLGTALSLGLNFYYMPKARTAYKETLAESLRQNPLSFIVPKTFVRNFPNVILYVGERDGLDLRDFWIWQLDEQKRVKVFARAESGRFDYDEEANRLVLTLRHVSVENRDDKDLENFSKPLTTGVSEEVPVELELDRIFGRTTRRTKLSELTYDQLQVELGRFAEPAQALDRMKVSIAIHEKASSAFAVFAFALLAIPLGIKVSRSETSANLGVALVLVMIYYFLTVSANWLENMPEMRPDLLLWVPTVLFLLVGGMLFRRADRA
jgi:lipopolysaccharide export system permease protein